MLHGVSGRLEGVAAMPVTGAPRYYVCAKRAEFAETPIYYHRLSGNAKRPDGVIVLTFGSELLSGSGF